MDGQELVRAIAALDAAVEPRTGANLPAVRVGPDRLLALMERLRDAPEFSFDMLVDHTAVDWIDRKPEVKPPIDADGRRLGPGQKHEVEPPIDADGRRLGPEQGHFECIYNLYSTTHGHRLLVSVSVPRDNPVVPSVASLWAIAEWQEREVFDLMGVLYDGHPDLRRLFLEDDWQGYPLRKDYHNADTPELSR